MHLQLVGRLKAGETYARISVDSGVLPEGVISFKLINLTVCQSQEVGHVHFPVAETANFPSDEVYEDTVEVRRPRPLLLGNRRRTFMFVPYIPPIGGDQPLVAGGGGFDRMRRFIEVSDDDDDDDDDERFHVPAVKRIKRADDVQPPLADLEFYFSSSFERALISKPLTATFPDLTLTSFAALLESTLGSVHINSFSALSSFRVLAKAIPASATTEAAGRGSLLQISVPPDHFLFMLTKEAWNAVGFSTEALTKRTSGTATFWGFINTGLNDYRVFTSTKPLRASANFGTIPSIPARLSIGLQILTPSMEARFAVTADALCPNNPSFAEYFFAIVLRLICVSSNFDARALKVDYSRLKRSLIFSKSGATATDDLKNYSLKCQLGARLAAILGLEATELKWIPGKTGLEVAVVRGAADAEDISAEECQTKMTNLPQEIYKLTTVHPLLKATAEGELDGELRRQQQQQQQQQREEEERVRLEQEEKDRLEKLRQERDERDRLAKLKQEQDERDRLAREREENELRLERERLATKEAREKEENELRLERERLAAKEAREKEENERLAERQRIERNRLAQEALDAAAQPPPEVREPEQVVVEEVPADVAGGGEEEEAEVFGTPEAGNVEEAPVDRRAEPPPRFDVEGQVFAPPRAGAAAAAEEEEAAPVEAEVEEEAAEEEVPIEIAEEEAAPIEAEVEEEAAEEEVPIEIEEEVAAAPIEAEAEEEEVAPIEAEAEAEVLEEEVAPIEAEADVEPVGEGGGDVDMPAEEEEEEEEPEEIREEAFEMVRVPNPIPRRAAAFSVATSGPRGRCLKPANFPEFCTLVLQEGEPNDYMTERGYVSVLGMVRKAQPSVVPNECRLKNVHRTTTLSIEFVDEGLHTFLIPAGQPDAFVKIDLRCSKI